ncbi:TetR/AcrR family transcriptional regulator [Streptomyces sp. NRRL F-525]|uniref:TetR/AcrR family transcriptional regulator n=1 Tax=Streptomyces sp. NRRL F-525 TaxID=1463861 RepID=UPI0009979B32|nr:TetR/AcrR family transcriptional regulator [Streptomyces sp. NRRL F-525]
MAIAQEPHPTSRQECALHGRKPSLRERKRLRTRQALIDAAVDLFDRQGYDETTIAEIADAADVSARTFFSYFASKEEILFPDSASRVQLAVDAIDARGPDDRPVDVLLRALQHVGEVDTDMVSRMAAVRMRLVLEVPAVRGRGLQILFSAQRDMARHLQAAFPDQLDEISAAALVGAMVGAISSALAALFDDPEQAKETLSENPDHMKGQIARAAQIALGPWIAGPGVP